MIHQEKPLAALPQLLKEALYKADREQLSELVSGYHPEDVAESILALDDDEILRLLIALEDKVASEIVANMDSEYRADILEKMDQEHLSDILEEMAADDAADLIAELDEETAADVLAHSDQEAIRHVTSLLRYPEDTAGGMMDSEIIYVTQEHSCEAVIQLIRENTHYFKSVHFIYVTDAQRQLIGFVTLPALITADPRTPIAEIMNQHLIAVDVTTDQEEVIAVFKKYDLVTLPIVDEDLRLVGLITIDDVVDVMEEENEEDMLRMAAIAPVEGTNRLSAGTTALYRLPWLLTCLLGGMVSASVIHLFQNTLSHVIVLASFIPTVMGMGGNSGIQSSTMTVRSLATGSSIRNSFRQLIWREMKVAGLVGALCGTVAGTVAHLFFQKGLLGVVVGLSMFFSISLSACMGIVLPFLFDKTEVDPAVASGPVITTLNDSLALLVYLGLATLFLHWLS